MKTKIAVVIFSLLVLGAIGLFILLDEQNFSLVAMAPTATRTPTKTPRPTRTLVPTMTSQPQPTITPRSLPTKTPTLPPTPPPALTVQPTTVVSSTAFTPPPSPTRFPSPTRARSPTTRPQPTKTPKPTATLMPLNQFVGNDDDKSLWLSTYSPNCGSMGIGKRFSRVIDAQGKPVAGVVIRLWWPDAHPDQYMHCTTGNDGSFEFTLGLPRDLTVYVTVVSHWDNPVENSETLTIHFQKAVEPDCLVPADGGTGLGHQWAVVVFTKLW